jgi:hypothetical protein
MIPDAAGAAVPWSTSFLGRRGLTLRGKEAEVLAGYVLEAAAPHLEKLQADAWEAGSTAGLAWDENRETEFTTPNPYQVHS